MIDEVDEGKPKCDTIECVEYAVKYYRKNGFDERKIEDRENKLRNILGSGCQRSDENSAVECAMDAVWDVITLHKNNPVAMENLSEICDWEGIAPFVGV